jgi:hypothetical protein
MSLSKWTAGHASAAPTLQLERHLRDEAGIHHACRQRQKPMPLQHQSLISAELHIVSNLQSGSQLMVVNAVMSAPLLTPNLTYLMPLRLAWQ